MRSPGVQQIRGEHRVQRREQSQNALYTNRLRLKCECKIFFEVFYLLEFDSVTRFEAVLDNRRSYFTTFHIDFYLKLKEFLLYLYFFSAYLVLVNDDVFSSFCKQVYTWKFPVSKLRFFEVMFFCFSL